jgi:hypothetical protein
MISEYPKLSTIAQVINVEDFTMILNGIFHQRIDYPDHVIREFNGGKKKNHANYNRKQAETNKH